MAMERLGTHPDVKIQQEILADNFNPQLTRGQHILGRLVPGYYRHGLRFDGRNVGSVLKNTVVGGWGYHAGINGFKLIESQWHALAQDQQRVILSLPNLRVIYIDRKDMFSHFVSLERAGQFGFRFRREGAPAQDLAPVLLCPKKFMRFVDSHKLNKVYFRQVFASFPFMEMIYERLVDNAKAENRRMLDFLGLWQAPLSDRLIRNSDAPLCDRVANLDEFCVKLHGTPYARFLPSARQLQMAGPNG